MGLGTKLGFRRARDVYMFNTPLFYDVFCLYDDVYLFIRPQWKSVYMYASSNGVNYDLRHQHGLNDAPFLFEDCC